MMQFFRKKMDTNPVFSYPEEKEPPIYDSNGRLKRVFYIRDNHIPAYSGSKYFEWDRANYGLKTHFYTHHHMNELIGNPEYRYGMLVESKTIVPDNYRIFKRYPGLEKEFDYIFTYDDELLNDLSNAKFFPYCAHVWYRQNNDYDWDDFQYLKKKKNISIVSSNKNMCYLHRVRMEIARKCREMKLADVYGTIDGGTLINIDKSLEEYHYSIVIENDISDYFFSEKITNCFASQTIPIYVGARKISDFFNIDGIIYINDLDMDNIINILRECTTELYESKRSAIIDNYHRVCRYKNIFDMLYEDYKIE